MTPTDRYHVPFSFKLFFFMFLFLFFSLFVRGMPPNGDPVNYFVVARSIVETGSAGMEKIDLIPLERGTDGKYYSKFGIGQSLLEAPFYAVARMIAPGDDGSGYRYSFLYFITVLSIPAVSALSAVFFLMLLCAAGFDKKTSMITTLLFAFATMIWPYAKLGFSEPLQVCAIASALYFALMSGEGGAEKYSAWCAVSMGILILTKISMIVVVPMFFIYLLLSRLPGGATIKRRAIPFTFVFSVFVAAVMYYNFARFGSATNFGYFSGKDSAFGFSTPLLSGLYGLFFSPGKSVFIYVPVVFISMAAIPDFNRERRELSLLSWSSIIVVVLMYAKWWAWHGDYAWGPRFLTPLIPFAMLPAAVFIRDFKSKKMPVKVLALAIIVFSICMQALAVSVNFYEHITLVRHQVTRNAFFMPGRPDLRDDQLLVHFVPEFSPVAGQWWILKNTLKDKYGGEKNIEEVMKKDFPWKGLMSYNVPKNPGRTLGFDTWWSHFPRFFPESKAWVQQLLAFMLIGAVLCAFASVVAWRKT